MGETKVEMEILYVMICVCFSYFCCFLSRCVKEEFRFLNFMHCIIACLTKKMCWTDLTRLL